MKDIILNIGWLKVEMVHQSTDHRRKKEKVGKGGQRHGGKNVCGVTRESIRRCHQEIRGKGTEARGFQYSGKRVSKIQLLFNLEMSSNI
jgi:hypothetical protein